MLLLCVVPQGSLVSKLFGNITIFIQIFSNKFVEKSSYGNLKLIHHIAKHFI